MDDEQRAILAAVADLTAERAKTRHQVTWVGGDETTPCFAYTIGLPVELMILYVSPQMSTVILTALVDSNPGVVFETGVAYSLGAAFPVVLYEPNDIALREMPASLAKHFHGTDDVKVLVLGICDKHGRSPFDPDCDEPYCQLKRWLREPS